MGEVQEDVCAVFSLCMGMLVQHFGQGAQFGLIELQAQPFGNQVAKAHHLRLGWQDSHGSPAMSMLASTASDTMRTSCSTHSCAPLRQTRWLSQEADGTILPTACHRDLAVVAADFRALPRV